MHVKKKGLLYKWEWECCWKHTLLCKLKCMIETFEEEESRNIQSVKCLLSANTVGFPEVAGGAELFFPRALMKQRHSWLMWSVKGVVIESKASQCF